MRKKIFILLVALSVITFSCRKDPNFDQLSSNFTVVTNFDTTAVFQSYKTYYISDTIAYIGGTNDSILYDNNAKQLVDAVKQNMDARGYSFVAKNAHPDLVS